MGELFTGACQGRDILFLNGIKILDMDNIIM